MIDLPEGSSKKLNFTWLLKEFRSNTLNKTLDSIKKREVADMMLDLEFNMTQLSEKRFQGSLSEGKYSVMIKELAQIKDIFTNNLSQRVNEDSDEGVSSHAY